MQPYAASSHARCVRTVCCSAYLARAASHGLRARRGR